MIASAAFTLCLLSLLFTTSSFFIGKAGYRRAYSNTLQMHLQPSSAREQSTRQVLKSATNFASVLVGVLGVQQQVVNAKTMKNGEYLREPTADFKTEQANTKAMDARMKKERDQWDKLFTKFESSKTAEELEGSLKALIAYLNALDGVPTGFSKVDLVKRCRARRNDETKKRRKPVPKEEWTTKVEIQYQALIQAWNKAVSPQTMGDKMAF